MKRIAECVMVWASAIGFSIAVWILILSQTGCGEVGDFLEDIGQEIEEVDGDNPVPDKPIEVIPPAPLPTQSPVATPTPKPVSNDFFIPNNCANPPKNISFGDGFKCMASNTRGGSIVCLLPYQFTWKPYTDFTDHHGVTMKCNKNDEHFDAVDLILKSGKRISLSWDKCQNWVGAPEGKIGRQHWRNEATKWDSVKDKVATIEMIKGNKSTCLRF